jgi:hypothetical protein
MSAHLDSLAWHIDRFGYDAVTQQHLDGIRSTAHAAGVRPCVIDLLVDETAPTPARDRAFAKVASFITRHLRTHTVVTDDQVACAA